MPRQPVSFHCTVYFDGHTLYDGVMPGQDYTLFDGAETTTITKSLFSRHDAFDMCRRISQEY